MRCNNSLCQKRVDQANIQNCPHCGAQIKLHNPIPLPLILRGRQIQQGNVVPTVARLSNIIQQMNNAQQVDPATLRYYEIACLRKYDLTFDLRQEIINPQNGDDWISIVRRNILAMTFPPLGVHPFTIYTVAWIAEHYEGGRQTFLQIASDMHLAGTENSINAIWTVGRRDGMDLELLNNDGTVADWGFFRHWIEG